MRSCGTPSRPPPPSAWSGRVTSWACWWAPPRTSSPPRTCCGSCGGGESDAGGGWQQGLELYLRLGQLGVRVRVGDDAVARHDSGGGAVDVRAADAHREGAVPAGVDPTDRAGVAASVEPLVAGDP